MKIKLTRVDIDEGAGELIGEDGLRQLAVISLDDVCQAVDISVCVEFQRGTALP